MSLLTDPPEVTISELGPRKSVGDRVTLRCLIAKGHPDHEITWYKEDQPIGNQKDEFYSFITKVGDNLKEYSCKANNGYEVEDSLILSFDGKPPSLLAVKKGNFIR